MKNRGHRMNLGFLESGWTSLSGAVSALPIFDGAVITRGILKSLPIDNTFY
jgi:hypothetical protein